MILRYPGGKFQLRQRILRHAPLDCEEYREPFVGGGHILFALPPDRYRRRCINDVDPELIAVYQALRDRPADFIAACRAIKATRDTFEKFVAGDGATDPALRYYYINRTSWGGLCRSLRTCFCHPAGWAVVHGDRLWEAARRLQGLEITAGDYTALLREPGKGVWVYCDAPYVKTTEDLYYHKFRRLDHTVLSVDVRVCKHKVLLSYDDNPLIRRLYDGLTVYTVPAYYRMARQPEWRRELLIQNY
jgi:DNA adenine methylase